MRKEKMNFKFLNLKKLKRNNYYLVVLKKKIFILISEYSFLHSRSGIQYFLYPVYSIKGKTINHGSKQMHDEKSSDLTNHNGILCTYRLLTSQFYFNCISKKEDD